MTTSWQDLRASTASPEALIGAAATLETMAYEAGATGRRVSGILTSAVPDFSHLLGPPIMNRSAEHDSRAQNVQHLLRWAAWVTRRWAEDVTEYMARRGRIQAAGKQAFEALGYPPPPGEAIPMTAALDQQASDLVAWFEARAALRSGQLCDGCGPASRQGEDQPAPRLPIRQGNIDNGSTLSALRYAALMGYDCRPDEAQIICFGASPVAFGHDQTIGDVWFHPGTERTLQELLLDEEHRRRTMDSRLDPDVFGPDTPEHEANHSEQWADYDSILGFAVDYGMGQVISKLVCPEEDWGTCHPMEIDANPYQGGYFSQPEVGADGALRPAENSPPIEEPILRYYAGLAPDVLGYSREVGGPVGGFAGLNWEASGEATLGREGPTQKLEGRVEGEIIEVEQDIHQEIGPFAMKATVEGGLDASLGGALTSHNGMVDTKGDIELRAKQLAEVEVEADLDELVDRLTPRDAPTPSGGNSGGSS